MTKPLLHKDTQVIAYVGCDPPGVSYVSSCYPSPSCRSLEESAGFVLGLFQNKSSV